MFKLFLENEQVHQLGKEEGISEKGKGFSKTEEREHEQQDWINGLLTIWNGGGN